MNYKCTNPYLLVNKFADYKDLLKRTGLGTVSVRA